MSASRILFSGRDAGGNADLWVTNGTSAGTSELAVAGANSGGLFNLSYFGDGFSPDFTVLGRVALFEGYDTNGRDSLWVTDGTSGGTVELTIGSANAGGLFFNVAAPELTVFDSSSAFLVGQNIAGNIGLWITDGSSGGTHELTAAGAFANGLFANIAMPDFRVLGGRALFQGQNAVGNVSLWITDGTSAGSSELIVSGANSGGLFNPNYFLAGFSPGFTVLGNAVLFEGYDAGGNDSLWVSDGTAAGTRELAISGAHANGVLVNVASPDLTVFGGVALFAGENASGNIGLWVTDGTSPGTHELLAAGAFANGLFSAVAEPDFTVLGGKALFQGQDAAGNVNLWVTDGTSAGTSELAVAGANSGGLFNATYFPAGFSPDFTVLGNVAVFEGYDASGSDSLWVTDGTSAGTSELTVAGANPSGLFAQVFGPHFTVFGGRVLFAGEDADGHINLWSTDGTSAGTGELSATGASPNGLAPTDLTVLPGSPATDVNGDRRSDLPFQNSSGEVVVWELNGPAAIGGGSLGNPGPSWHAVGTGDFNGDGHSGLLWQNSTGEIAVWELTEAGVIGGGSVGNPGPSWHAIVSGDFNNDGFSDILLQNSSGEVVIWALSGGSVIANTSLGNPGPSWHAIGSGDFNGDGFSDILWQNSSGEITIWELNGAGVIGASLGNPGPSWHAIGSGDFTRDGSSDILWQNDSGEVVIWTLNGATVIGGASLGNPGPSWHAAGSGDYNGDGFSDIRLQNSSGEVAVWELNGASVIGGGSLGNPGPAWHLAADSRPYLPCDVDLPWQSGGANIFLQNDDGQAALWAMNGAAIAGGGNIGNPGTIWHARALGDVDGNANPDILWQNDSGEAAVWELSGAAVIGGGGLGNPGAGLAHCRSRRFQPRRPIRFIVAERQRRGGDLGIERHRRNRRRRYRKPRSGMARPGRRRRQWRRLFRYPVAERQRRGRGLGVERQHCG